MPEITKRSVIINRSEEPCAYWHNNIFTIHVEKGLVFYEFRYDVKCLDKKLDLKEFEITTPNYSPASSFFNKRIMSKEIKNSELTEMIVDPALWPHNEQLLHEMARIITFEWSPVPFLYNNQYALAVLNNVGNIDIFGPSRNKWTSILNVSELAKNYFAYNSFKCSTIEEAKQAAYVVGTCAACWGPASLSNSQCNLAIAQKNGTILLWTLNSHGTGISANVIGQIETDTPEIRMMIWIQRTNDDFSLVCSNVVGQILALECTLQNDRIILVKTSLLWSYKDRMIPKFLKHAVVDGKGIILCTKNRHLFVLMIDSQCNLLAQHIQNVNDHKITDLLIKDSEIYVCTLNCKIYKIEITISGESLNVKLIDFDIKELSPTTELYGHGFSNNKLIHAISVIDRKISYRKEPMKLEIIFKCEKVSHDTEINMLLDNPTKSLNQLWDCIELLRYKSVKSRSLPEMDYKKLWEESNSDLYKLKLYLILATINNSILVNTKHLLPVTNISVIKDKLLLEQAKVTIDKLYGVYQDSETLTCFELESFIGARNYIIQHCQKYSIDLSNFDIRNKFNIIKTETEYTCQCCDLVIKDFKCENGHVNMFCSLTFTLIEDNDYLICTKCNATARTELYPDKPCCPFCDNYFNYVELPL